MVKKNILIIITIALFLVTAFSASARLSYICPDPEDITCPDPEPECLDYGDRYCSSINCCGGEHLTCSGGTCVCASDYKWDAFGSICIYDPPTAVCALLTEHPSATSEKRCCNRGEPNVATNPWYLKNSGDTCVKEPCALLNEHPSGTSNGICCAIGERGNLFNLIASGGVCVIDTTCLSYGESICPAKPCCAVENLACSSGTCVCTLGYAWNNSASACTPIITVPTCALENEKPSITTLKRCCNVGENGNTKTLINENDKCIVSCPTFNTYYPDADSDGYGKTSAPKLACTAPPGYIPFGGDCDDTNRYVHPGATEVCAGGVDEDCDGLKDCADPDCAGTKACVNCIVDSDCPDAPGNCYTPRCVGGTCTITNINCATDDYCCYPYCNPITLDADCDGGCGAVPLGQSATMTFRPVPTGGVGQLWAFGDRTTIRGIGTRSTSKTFAATVTNKLSGNMNQCNYPDVMRGFAIMDTSCIKDDSNITSANFNFAIDGRSGGTPSSVWLDQSSVPDSSNDWIINPASTQLPNAIIVGQSGGLFPPGTYSLPINPTYIERGVNNRFVLKIGNSVNSDFNLSNDFGNCAGSGARSCGEGGRCECHWNGNYPSGAQVHTPCGTEDPCYYVGNLAFECYLNPPWNGCGDGVTSHPTWDLLPRANDRYNCWNGAWLEGTVTGETPILEITFCNPYYFGDCDNSNGCTGAPPKITAPYNGCDITSWADAICGTENNCTDGIDNDCDGLIDCTDPDCVLDSACIPPEESIAARNCDDDIDNDNTFDCDYDNSTDCDGNISTVPHGDHGCPVRIDSIGVNNTNPCQGQELMVYCTASASGVNSVFATLNNALCNFIDWSGNVALFSCPVIGAGVQEARCSIDWAKSFQDPAVDGDKTMIVNVGGCPSCPIKEICDNGQDDDCDTLIDASDSLECPEGSGNETTSIYRQCGDNVNNDPWHDDPEVLIDMDDDGCCDLCNGAGFVFDSTKSALSAIPGAGCGSTFIKDWETGTEPYCCGDDINITTGVPFEFLKANPANPSIVACCNSSSHCTDSKGKCQVGVEETFDLCTDGLDNDCDGLTDGQDVRCGGNVVGFVFNDKGFPVRGAVVKSSPPGIGSSFENSTLTNATGQYVLRSIVGNYTFIARKEGYDDNATLVNVLPDGLTEVNFTLHNGSCHADCTDYYGNCNPACEGLVFVNNDGQLEACSFINALCYDRPKNFRATSKNLDTNITTEYTCCKGPERTYRTLKATVTGNMKDLYDYVVNVKFMGRQAKLHILTWNSE